MAGINTGRVIAGGLVAGLIINISETILNAFAFAREMEEALAARNLPPIGGGAIAYFVLWGFATGILLVWLYAAIRPRYGPGPKTAVCAALFVWFLAYFSGNTAMYAMGIMPFGLSVIGWIWGLVELVAASLGGARIYQEATV
jgi:hypothetical protein